MTISQTPCTMVSPSVLITMTCFTVQQVARSKSTCHVDIFHMWCEWLKTPRGDWIDETKYMLVSHLPSKFSVLKGSWSVSMAMMSLV